MCSVGFGPPCGVGAGSWGDGEREQHRENKPLSVLGGACQPILGRRCSRPPNGRFLILGCEPVLRFKLPLASESLVKASTPGPSCSNTGLWSLGIGQDLARSGIHLRWFNRWERREYRQTWAQGKGLVTTGSRYCPLFSDDTRGGISSPRQQELGKVGVLAGARVTEGQSHCQETELRERREWEYIPRLLSFCPLAPCEWPSLILSGQ